MERVRIWSQRLRAVVSLTGEEGFGISQASFIAKAGLLASWIAKEKEQNISHFPWKGAVLILAIQTRTRGLFLEMFCLQPTPTSGSGAAVNPGGFWRETMVNPLPGWQSFERWPSRPQSVCSFTCYTPVIVSLSISPWCSVVKASACNTGDPSSIPGSGNPLGKKMATHSSILAWRIPWLEEPGSLGSTGMQRVG